MYLQLRDLLLLSAALALAGAALAAIVFTIVVLTLAIYLTLIDSRLRVVSKYLGKIAFGVQAVETQTSPRTRPSAERRYK